MQAGPQGIFVISWSQTRIGADIGPGPAFGHGDAPDLSDHESWPGGDADPDMARDPVAEAGLVPGASWRWHGEAMRLDGPAGLLPLGRPAEALSLRPRAARSVGRILARGGAVMAGAERPFLRLPPDPQEAAYLPEDDTAHGPQGSFAITDGHSLHRLRVIARAAGAPLVVFDGTFPAPGRDYWVVGVVPLEAPEPPSSPRDPATGGQFTCGIVGDTPIATPEGLRAAADLRAGDPVFTRDGGPQRLIGVVRHEISGARLHAMPHLRPVRLPAGLACLTGAGARGGTAVLGPDVLVAPGHSVMVQGAAVARLFGMPEVLVRAVDLVGHGGVRRVSGLARLELVHLRLADDHLLCVGARGTGGLMVASGPVGDLPPEAMVSDRAAVHGPLGARRVLPPAETAILRHGLGAR